MLSVAAFVLRHLITVSLSTPLTRAELLTALVISVSKGALNCLFHAVCIMIQEFSWS